MFFFGDLKYHLLSIILYEINISHNAIENHIIGENNNDSNTSNALCQFGATLSDHCIGKYIMAIDTQSIDHINAWELEAGRAKYQVVRFHIIAENNKAATTQIQKVIGCSAITDKGNKCIIAIATQIHHNSTHRKFKNHANITALLGFNERVYITGAIALAVSLNQFTNSKAHTRQRHATSSANIHVLIPNTIFKY